ncbi:hypothetical protein Syun_001743 [Stephania yunnanensis]|uniref:Receptor-like serine/threonine-protein kinase n=1 Tax=Stephania yunnanensis TaxID=152371 RepID=A0AAP0LEC9_9MAGN
MHGYGRNQPKTKIPIKHFKGMSFRDLCFDGTGSILAVILVLGSMRCVFSVPLGFEISGYDRAQKWVSENGVFGFGFIDDYLGNDDGFVVGICYNLGGKGANVPVWTVGGGARVSDNSTFMFSMDGKLVLIDNLNGVVHWSSNTSDLGVQNATLMNNGNLVLEGNNGEVVWESFNSPTNTLLPGQSLHFPQSLRAPSTHSVSSYYSFVIGRFGELALVWEDNVTYWSSHFTFPVDAKEVRLEADGVLRLVDTAGATVWSKSSEDFRESSEVLRHVRIDPDGNLRMYYWDADLHLWNVGWQAVENQCNVFASCGLYSICGYKSTGAVCDCLSSDSSNKETGLPASRSHGCKKMVDLGNCKMGFSMTVLKKTVLYGLYPPHDFDIMLNQEACKDYCSNSTSCIASTSRNDGSGLCTIKRSSFISGYQGASVSAISFLKVCLAPQAVSTGKANPDVNVSLVSSSLGHSLSYVYSWKNFVVAVALIVLLTVFAFLILELSVFWFVHWRRKVRNQRTIPFGKDTQMNPHYSALIRLSFEEVNELMDNFRDQLGPTVFKGLRPNKTSVIAKALSTVVASEREFRMVVSTLGGTHHKNLVRLKGFCFEPKHKILLYDYISNGSLENWLFNPKQKENSVNWQQKLDIALGIARALAYLHSECQQCIAHGNLKLNNVLLDENFTVKVTDFGLQCLIEKETASSCSESSPERDIYMFGKMLLQILLGKRDIGDDPHRSVEAINQDQKLQISCMWDGIERASRIALWCVQDPPFLRPSFKEVVKVLEGTLSVDRPPPDTAFRKAVQSVEEDNTEIQVVS